MARQRRRIMPLIQRLSLPRITRYQQLCFNLARLIPELPCPQPVGTLRGPATQLRHMQGLPGYVLDNWLNAVLAENVLAGVVLVDALYYIWERLEFLAPRSVPVYPDREAKGAVTSSLRQLYVDFQVPPGWELLLGRSEQAGFSGLARVERCHLSKDLNWHAQGEGRLVGQAGQWLEWAAGFSMPCVYFPPLHLEENDLVAAGADVPGTPVQLPWAFVRQQVASCLPH
jgi:hypothetical protein